MEYAGKINIINKFNENIYGYQDELTSLEDKKARYNKNISHKEDEMGELKEKYLSNPENALKTKLDAADKKLQGLKKNLTAIDIQISQKNDLIGDLEKERDERIKKILMQLHSKIKKDHAKADREHARYVELYTKEREKKHDLERKMMNLKMMVYKEYGIRLI